MRFPVVEGYAFALVKNQIRCDIDAMEGLQIEPNLEPTATFVRAAVGYQIGPASQVSAQFGFHRAEPIRLLRPDPFADHPVRDHANDRAGSGARGGWIG
jgi:hypothetical protein